MRRIELLAALAMLAVATPAMAQSRGRGDDGIPPGQRPRAGMCRIWINGLAPGRQAAPTDCATARARVPLNGRILVGPRLQTNRRLNTANGEVVTVNGQRCVQRTDRSGVLRTVCPNIDRRHDDHADRHDDDRDDHKGRKKPGGDRND
jgi:hypothetical protein